jgi:hypothetical protein
MAFKAIDDAIEALKKRMSSVEGRSSALETTTTTHTSDIASVEKSQEWASKGGPSSWVSAYKATWAKGIDSGGSVDAHSNAQGIVIGETGIYEVVAQQRANGTGSGYIALALNGNRTTLENRTNGVFAHDHAVSANVYTTSHYMGELQAGEVITAGAPEATTSGYLTYATTPLTGQIYVRRIS